MKKMFGLALLAMAGVMFTACSDDDDNGGGNPSGGGSSSGGSSGGGNGAWGSWFIHQADSYPKNRLDINNSIVDKILVHVKHIKLRETPHNPISLQRNWKR